MSPSLKQNGYSGGIVGVNEAKTRTNVISLGIKLPISTNYVNTTNEDEPFQQLNCVDNHVIFLVNQCSYGYAAAIINELC